MIFSLRSKTQRLKVHSVLIRVCVLSARMMSIAVVVLVESLARLTKSAETKDVVAPGSNSAVRCRPDAVPGTLRRLEREEEEREDA